MTELSSTPQTPAQVLSQGIGFGVNSFASLFLFTTLTGFLGLIPVLYLALHTGNVVITPEVLHNARDGKWWLLEIGCWVVGILVQAILVQRVDNLIRQGHADLRRAWPQVLHAWPLLCLSSVVFYLALIIGYILLILPGIFLTVALIFFQFCLVLERLGPMQALNRSYNLVLGHWWRTFWVLLLMLFLILLVAVCLFAPVALLTGLHTEFGTITGRDLLLRGVLQMVGAAVFGPFVLAILYVQYHDLHLRRALSGTA